MALFKFLFFVFLATFLSFAFILFFVLPDKPSMRTPATNTDVQKRRNVIVLSEPRSGSSFTGEIFAQHTDVFYLYEPLFHLLPMKRKASETPENQRRYNTLVYNLLSNIFTCNFSDRYYLKELKTKRNKMKCPDESADSLWMSQSCGVQLTQENLEYLCKRRKVTVAKMLITRLITKDTPTPIKQLSFLCNSDYFDCLFIYLVRDPRAVISSLLNLGFFDKKKENILKSGEYSEDYLLGLVEPKAKKICQTVEDNIQFINELPPWLRDKFVILRYEDLVSNPRAIVEDLYDFVGLPVIKNVEKWIRESTTPTETEAAKYEKKPYSMVRNSLEVITKWRRTEQSNVVKIIEENCEKVMERLGYIPTGGSEDLQQDLDTPLFTKDSPFVRT